MYGFISECTVFGGKDFVMIRIEIRGDFVIRYGQYPIWAVVNKV